MDGKRRNRNYKYAIKIGIHGGYKLGEAVYNKVETTINNYQTETIMNSINLNNVSVSEIKN